MAVTSEVEIVNSALVKMGIEIITTLTAENNRARVMAARYPMTRDALLRSHPWNFTISYASLALVSPKPSNIFDYGYVFDLPSDCTRVLETDLCDGSQWEEIEGRRIACDSDSLNIKYIKRIVDVTKYDDNFCEALAWALAADTCYAFVQQAQLRDSIIKNAADYLRPTRSYDAQVGSVRRVVADTFITSRGGGGSRFR